ncbi:MAG: thiamine-phosphate kinase [Cyanobacteria bacterium]|nr:thiamine-phosphate kinase [Cyanobacteriota bacterium]MDW8202726.1 thiamine-phosphate kinase [Cyanobacteriota bacterium SKYGB_h_bin112]
MSPTVNTIGEQGLLKLVQQFCPVEVVGDDGAILTLPPGQSLVVTSDVLVDGVHFSVGLATPTILTTSPADAGWRAAAANLSDLAAMGAMPLGITVGLTLPDHCPVHWVEELYQGMRDCLHPYQVPIVGGDICRSSVLSLAITALGQVAPDRAMRRSTAQPGDAIVVTGYHGASRAGLELLTNPQAGLTLSADDRATFIHAHQRPIPRLDVLPLLNSRPVPTGMDSSDGLANAIVQICRASGVGAQVDLQTLPMPPAFAAWLPQSQAIDWTLYGGEDFELVLCLPPEPAKALVAQLGNGSAIIGTIQAAPEIMLIDPKGHYPPQPLSLDRGFQHFT